MSWGVSSGLALLSLAIRTFPLSITFRISKFQCVCRKPPNWQHATHVWTPPLKVTVGVATSIKAPSLCLPSPEIPKDPTLTEDIQQELEHTALYTVTVAVEIWYDSVPSSTIIEGDLRNRFRYL